MNFSFKQRGFWRGLGDILMPCVGLVVFGGCLILVMAPEDSAVVAERRAAPLTVVIDPGHGGLDDGARGNGLIEKNLTLDVSMRLEKILNGAGIQTVMTRRSDIAVSLAARAIIANDVANALFVSIHFNQSGYRSARGIETYFALDKVPREGSWTWVGFFSESEPAELAEGEALAGIVQKAIVTQIAAADRGTKGQALYVVRHVQAPAVLIEGGFLSNPEDARLLADPAHRERLAAAIASGLLDYRKLKQVSAPQLAAASR